MKEKINEAINREDSIWLSLDAGVHALCENEIVEWDDVKEINGDYGNIKGIVVVGIPLYRDAAEALQNATKFIFNQIEIFEKTKENQKILQEMA